MALDISKQLKHIENRYNKGLYRKALDEIRELENLAKKNFNDCISCQILKSKIMFNLGYYEDSYEIIKIITEKTKAKELLDLYIEAIIVEIEISFNLGKYEYLIDLITESDKLISKLPKNIKNQIFKLQLIIQKGYYYEIKGEFERALELYNEALNISEVIGDRRGEAKALFRIGLINRFKGKRDRALEYMLQVLTISEELEDTSLKALMLKEIGTLYGQKGLLDESLNFTKQSLDLYKIVGSILDLGKVYINLGVIYEYKGDLTESLKYYNVALNIFKETGNISLLAAAYNNISGIMRKQGKLQESLTNIKLALKVFQEINNIMNIIAVFNTMGQIYHYLGDLENAYLHLQMAYQLKDKIKNNLSLSKTLYYLISILIDKGEFEKALQLLNEFEIIIQYQDNQTILHRYLISKARLYEKSDNTDDKINAQEIYNQIIEDAVTDFETTMDARINLCHNLLDDPITSNDIEKINEINKQMTFIKENAKSQLSLFLEIEVMVINARLTLIKGKQKEGLKLFNQAKNLAKTIDYKLIEIKNEKYFTNLD
ncbi:MAG TPA: tetratricopeptide repeat protein [Candidatus Bathyarchaeia archaeon]|nr:tetratricopeptide repeat protein [Candidatus Bathyarchaeia archaeon]